MAHVKKYGRAVAGHIAKHFERGLDENGQYIKFGNADIDLARTHLNYNLAPCRPDGQVAFLNQRCSEVSCSKRKDLNVMCSWVITAPKNIAGTYNEAEFFRQTYKFLEQKYGQENVISAYVHKDETTPHIHFAFVPVVEDQKKKHLKVSAKECIDKFDLQKFHGQLDKHLLSSMSTGYQGGILNGVTKDGNRSIDELKRQSAIDRMHEALPEIDIGSMGRKLPVGLGVVMKAADVETLKTGYATVREIPALKMKLDKAEKTVTALDAEKDSLRWENTGLKHNIQEIADGRKFYIPRIPNEIGKKIQSVKYGIWYDDAVERYYCHKRTVYESALKIIESARRRKEEMQSIIQGIAQKAWGRVRSFEPTWSRSRTKANLEPTLETAHRRKRDLGGMEM